MKVDNGMKITSTSQITQRTQHSRTTVPTPMKTGSLFLFFSGSFPVPTTTTTTTGQTNISLAKTE